MRTIKMPRGVKEGDNKVRISVVLDQKVFDDVCTFGRNQGWSFSVAINDLAKCGILDMRDAELWEGKAAPATTTRSEQPCVTGTGSYTRKTSQPI